MYLSMKNELRIVFLLVFVSGFSGLVYQGIWDRLARSNFGGDNISATIVLSTFLLGLGLGAYLFRNVTNRSYIGYGLVEIAIGIFGFFSIKIIANVALVIGSFSTAGVESIEGIRLAAIVGCFLFLIPPCILIGATLPMMFNCFINSNNFSATTVGKIYGVNTFGGMAGVIAVPLIFLNYMSIQQTLSIIAVLNIVAGILICWLGYHHKADNIDGRSAPRSNRDWHEKISFATLSALAALTGVITIAVELSLIRHSFSIVPSSPYNFSLVLAPILFAMGLGGYVFPALIERKNWPVGQSIGLLLIGASLAFLFSIWLSDFVAVQLASDLRQNLIVATIYFSMMTIPLFFVLGGIFPLLCRLASGTVDDLPNRTGVLYLYSSFGAFIGAVFIQFVGFKLIGTPAVVSGVALICSICGGWLVVTHRRSISRLPFALAPVIIVALFYQTNVWSSYVSGRPVVQGEASTRLEGQTGVAEIVWGQSNVNAGILYVGHRVWGRCQ